MSARSSVPSPVKSRATGSSGCWISQNPGEVTVRGSSVRGDEAVVVSSGAGGVAIGFDVGPTRRRRKKIPSAKAPATGAAIDAGELDGRAGGVNGGAGAEAVGTPGVGVALRRGTGQSLVGTVPGPYRPGGPDGVVVVVVGAGSPSRAVPRGTS